METYWKTKEGLIKMSDMSEEHLQNALTFAEQKYMLYNNQMNTFSEKSAIFQEKMLEIKAEAKRRGTKIKSLHEMSKNKYEILKKFYYVAQMPTG